MAIVAYASLSENGTINGKIGDQTGKEVKISDYYDFGQTYYFRFYKSEDAWWMADIMKRIANNNNVGYGQNDRTTLFNLVKSNGWQSSKINKKVNTDCSGMVTVAFNCIYEEELLKSDTYTGNLKDRLKNTGKGVINTLNKKKYKPMIGDIVAKNGHVVVVVG